MAKVSNKSDLISIIIPVYNVEKYIANCLESVINQTYNNIEIIIINDGSTDNSQSIINEYSKKDTRIKKFIKENGGLSDARNYGLDKANGTYVTFIDSDDSITTDYVEYLYNLIKMNDAEMSIASIKVVANKKELDYGQNYKNKILSQKETLRRMVTEEGFTVGAWAKLYKKNLFDNIRYPKGDIFEEIATTYKLVLLCDDIPYGNKAIYNYYKRNGSIINSEYNSKKLLRIKYSHVMGDAILNKYNDLYIPVESYILDSYFYVYRLMLDTKLNKEDQKIKKKIKIYLKKHKKEVLHGEFKNRTKMAMILLSFGDIIFKYSWKFYSKIKYGI